jgi:hypothetical protein
MAGASYRGVPVYSILCQAGICSEKARLLREDAETQRAQSSSVGGRVRSTRPRRRGAAGLASLRLCAPASSALNSCFAYAFAEAELRPNRHLHRFAGAKYDTW